MNCGWLVVVASSLSWWLNQLFDWLAEKKTEIKEEEEEEEEEG